MRARTITIRQAADGSRPRPLHEDFEAVAANGAGGNGRRPLPAIAGRLVDPERISAEVEEMGAEEAIAWAIETFGSGLGFAVSFQKTSSVIIDIAHRIDPSGSRSRSRSPRRAPALRFFYLDTDLLFPETYETRDRLSQRFGIEFQRFAQDNPPGLRERWEANLWRESDECCATRKVATMHRALEGIECWVSGVRRVDSPTRAESPRFGWDPRFDRWKLNPLVDWTDQQVWNYIHENHVPYNPLHDQGYPSIGCMPCTSKAGPGEDPRAGRWAGTDRTECGLNG
jgi:phosphoadenosine phosphosulfate reductase